MTQEKQVSRFTGQPWWISYIVTYNAPGCLPDVEPQEFATLQEAIDCVLSDLNYYCALVDDNAIVSDAELAKLREEIEAVCVGEFDTTVSLRNPYDATSCMWHIEYSKSDTPMGDEE